MPYIFKFFVGKKLVFFDTLQCDKCVYIKNDGVRCKNTVCIGLPLCWIHLKKEKALKVKQISKTMGRGLFALADFDKGYRLIDYHGEIISKKQLEERYGESTAPYVVRINADTYEDGAIKRGIGTLVNHSNNPNAKLYYDTRNKVVKVMAVRDIKAGQQILVDYGDEYDFDENSSHKTVYGKQ